MTAFRTVIFALVCTFFTTSSFANIISSGIPNPLDVAEFFHSVKSTWRCETQDGVSFEDISLDADFHKQLFAGNQNQDLILSAENLTYSADKLTLQVTTLPFADTMGQSAKHNDWSNGKLVLIAKTLWKSLWMDERLMFEILSETAFKILSDTQAADDTSGAEITCTKSEVVNL